MRCARLDASWAQHASLFGTCVRFARVVFEPPGFLFALLRAALGGPKPHPFLGKKMPELKQKFFNLAKRRLT